MNTYLRCLADRAHRPAVWLTPGALCACFFIVVPSATCNEPDGEVVDASKTLGDYRRAFDRLLATYQNVRIEGTVRMVQAPQAAKKGAGPQKNAKGSDPPVQRGFDQQYDFSYIFCDGKEKGTRAIKGSGKQATLVDAGKDRFGLARAGPGQPYTVTQHSSDDEDQRALFELRARVRDAPYRPGEVKDFQDYVRSPHFSVKEARRITREGRPLIRLVIHYNPPTEPDLYIGGRMDLDETLGLAIRGYELEFRRFKGRLHMRASASVQYAQENGKAVPTRISYQTQRIPVGGLTRWEYNISKYSFESTPPEAFTLAHYGLGDFERTLSQVEKRNTYRTYVVAATAFLIGLFICEIARRMLKRRAAASVRAEQAPVEPELGEMN